MRAREIARGDWQSFFDRLTRLLGGAIVNVNVSSALVGCMNTITSQPLRGISADHDDILIHIGARRRLDHIGHRVPHVRAVRLQQTDEGRVAAVDLDATDGTRTVVRFRSPILPELLDPAVE
jgi:uncharacterized protein DUF5335